MSILSMDETVSEGLPDANQKPSMPYGCLLVVSTLFGGYGNE